LQPKANGPFQGGHLFGLACYFWGVAGVHLLARSLSGNRWFGLACAAMWALAPTQVSTILWLSGANISLSVGFLCAALCFYDKARTSPGGAGRLSVPLLLLAVTFGFAALISYETAVALAPLAVALDWYRGRTVVSRQGIVAAGILVATRTVVRIPHPQQAALMGYAELEETVALLGLENPPGEAAGGNAAQAFPGACHALMTSLLAWPDAEPVQHASKPWE
jgi:hypothetical protein